MATQPRKPKPIAPKELRYIKLGGGDRWFRPSLERGEIHFGYRPVPHALCEAGKWDKVRSLLAGSDGGQQGQANARLREIRDFYLLGADCLWITFAEGHLWWAFSAPTVTWIDGEDAGLGSRTRPVLDRWRNCDITGRPLRTVELSSKLTQVAAYRRTLCKVHSGDYLIRRINAHEEPLLTQARQAQAAMTTIAQKMIANLHWADFETLVDLIFSRSGWQRVSRVGGSQKDFDLVLEEPATGQSAFVQVKSRAGRDVLADYVERYDASDVYDRMFFVSHSILNEIPVSDRDDVHVWTGERLAEKVVRVGLFDWLVERSC